MTTAVHGSGAATAIGKAAATVIGTGEHLRLLDPVRERARSKVAGYMLLIYVLLIVEGALRKWFLEPIHQIIFFIRDPFVLICLYQCYRHRLIRGGFLLGFSAVMCMCCVVLGVYQIITTTEPPIAPPLVFAYGWRNYFYYLFFALAMASVLRREEVLRFLRWTLVMTVPMAFLAFVQWQSPRTAWINKGIGNGLGFVVTGLVVRTTGTFTFTAGFVCFVGSALACLGALAFTETRRVFLLVAGAMGTATCLATSGSRTAFIHAALTGMVALGSEATKPLGRQRPLVYVGALFLPLAIAGALAAFYPQAIELILKRNEEANHSENVDERILGNVLGGFQVMGDAGLGGRGIGLGSVGGAAVISGGGDVAFILPEDEFSRVVMEGGIGFGMAYMFLRFGLSFWMAVQSVRCIRERGDVVPAMLLSFTIVLLMYGQMTMQGTINGYGWIFTGLTMAAINTSRDPLTHAR